MRTDITDVVPVPHSDSPLLSPRRPHAESAAGAGSRPATGDGGVGARTDGDAGERLHEQCPEMGTPGYPWVASTAAGHADATPEVGRGNRLPNEAR